MVEDIDVHNYKQKLANIIEKINKFPESQAKEILLKYVEWHEIKMAKNKIYPSSTWRSLTEAVKLADAFPKPLEITQNQLEEWFVKETKRNALRRDGSDGLKDTGKPISSETIHKIQSQMIKFLKFCDFYKLNKPLELFNPVRMPIPTISLFCVNDSDESKRFEAPSITQKEIKDLIDYLRGTGNYIDEITAVATALMNDTGMRLSECVNLTHDSLRNEEGYWLVQLQTSKTATRTNVLLLSKEYLSLWLTKCPTKDDRKGLIFCSRDGSKISYGLIRVHFQEALKHQNLVWKKSSSFHYLRHLAASRFAEMPENLIRYYLGWKGGGMRSTYSAYNWKMILPYLMKANKGNPMADAKLSYMEEEQKTQDDLLLEMVRQAVKKELEKKN